MYIKINKVSQKKSKLFNINITLNILLFLFIFSFSLIFSSCDIARNILKNNISQSTHESTSASNESANSSSTEEILTSNSNNYEDNSTSSANDNSNIINNKTDSQSNVNNSKENSGENKLIYLEITSDEKSNHFEHRVANIYSINLDGNNKKLLYSDINDKYDLGPIFDISPDGKKISCMINDGGRGAYSALCVLDIEKKSLKNIVEFDYTNGNGDILLQLYQKPIWASDSKYLAYELISNPYSSNFRDGGIFLANIETGELKEISLDVGGASLRSTMFLVPEFFYENNKKIAAAFHPYYQVKKGDKNSGFYSVNKSLNSININGGSVSQLFEASLFKDNGPEIITSFNNFKFSETFKEVVFQVLGDFEEDGDLWVYNLDKKDLEKLTNDINLREQQPNILDINNNNNKNNFIISFVGVKRYGTVSNQIPSGDIYLIYSDGSNLKKLTNYNVGPSKPIFSPDGNYIAYLNSIYDENFENIVSHNIEVVSVINGKIFIPVKGDFIDLIGWIK